MEGIINKDIQDKYIKRRKKSTISLFSLFSLFLFKYNRNKLIQDIKKITILTKKTKSA